MQIENNDRQKMSGLPSLIKRGVCFFIQDCHITKDILKSVLEVLKKNREMSPEKTTRVRNELAILVYHKSLERIKESYVAALSQDDALEVLEAVSHYFLSTYDGIDKVKEKLLEYKAAADPAERVSRNILKILGEYGINITELVEMSTLISEAIDVEPFQRTRKAFELTEEDMTEIINHFFVNNYRQFITKENEQ